MTIPATMRPTSLFGVLTLALIGLGPSSAYAQQEAEAPADEGATDKAEAHEQAADDEKAGGEASEEATLKEGEKPDAAEPEALPDPGTEQAGADAANPQAIPEASGAVPEPAAAPPPPPPAEEEKPHWSDRITWKGDLRYRLELIGVDSPGSVLRHRHRIRARFGLKAEVLDDLDATIQVGTGSSNDPVSNNQSLGAAFSSKPIWLDLGYFDYHPYYAEGVHVLGGKMKNPLYTVGKSELLWDPDLNPEGLALQVQPDLGTVSPFVNGGYFWVEERRSPADSFILGAQAGLKLAFEPSELHVIVGGRYVDHMNIEGEQVFGDPEDSFGNTATDAVGDGILSYDYDYNLLGAFLEIGGKAGGMPWAVFADVVQNVAVDEESTGWLVGVKAGKCKKALDLCGRYIYKRVEADAVVGIFTDSDFNGGGTNSKGHEVNAGVQLADGVTSAATYFHNKTSIESGEDYHRLQLDLKMKF